MEITGIYGIRNKESGLWYIGQSVDVIKRQKQHASHLRKGEHHNRHLQRAFDKYGEDAFEWTLLEECRADNLDNREIYWIAEKDSFHNGYNQTLGGEGTCGIEGRGKKQVVLLDTGEIFDSVSSAAKSIGVRKDTFRKNLKNGWRLRGYWEHLPDDYSEEWRIRRLNERLAITKKYTEKQEKPNKPKRHRTGKGVVQFSLDGKYIAEYDSSVLAGDTLGINHRKIRMVCNGERNKCGGFVWRWKDDYHEV